MLSSIKSLKDTKWQLLISPIIFNIFGPTKRTKKKRGEIYGKKSTNGRWTSHRCGSKAFQIFNPKNGRWTKRDTGTGQFIDQESDDKPYKGVTKEK